ncbi:hypothetical protein V6N13_140575 [Hibiscus sabdariffa]|uniref:Uncharacterized protein n=2 Tax=Hibiscus sabdariffa TaxID=183260 RepID=A0ABR2Q2H3_9ROSI
MVVKVYGTIKAACPQRVLSCLLEKDVDFQILHLDLDAGDHKKPDFLLRQPFGQVPAIEDGDFKLFESRAIIRYYAAKYENRGPNLLGNTLEEKSIGGPMARSGSTQLQRFGLQSGPPTGDPASNGQARRLRLGSHLPTEAGQSVRHLRATPLRLRLSRRRFIHLGRP